MYGTVNLTLNRADYPQKILSGYTNDADFLRPSSVMHFGCNIASFWACGMWKTFRPSVELLSRMSIFCNGAIDPGRNITDKPIPYLTDDEEQKILKELDPSMVRDPKHKKGRQAAKDILILMIDAGFRINEASILKWSDVDFENGVINLYRSKVSNDDFIPMTNRLRMALLSRRKLIDGEYVFPGRFGGHKPIQNNRALEAAFTRAGLDDISSHNLRKTFATRLLSRGAAITDVQHLLDDASVKTTEKASAAFVKNESFKQTIDLLDKPALPRLKVVT